jgi:hypothetical protein
VGFGVYVTEAPHDPLFSSPTPVLDGEPWAIGDGLPRLRNLFFGVGEFATPFYVRPDGKNFLTQKIDALPAQLVLTCGSIEILSTAPPEP